MPTTYRIHPGVGIARLGNSTYDFCISPEQPAALPIACDKNGNPMLSPDGDEVRITTFKDEAGRLKRQAARFQVWAYDDEHPEGRPLKLGDQIEGGGNAGTLMNIQWRVYLANKKA
ncbi:MAG TPA: LodA/GoxA family CTQ-dependent oxidase, partial [Pyrinomonadaceae bacterium]|nr:LodA/GoxA family CTQ-dependent oxidase [Pyrinomonadaceae bacterium]